MDRREFLVRAGQIGLGFSAVIVMGGCGGGGAETRIVPSELKTVRINLNQEQVRVISVTVGSSILDALKAAFVYEREAPFEDVSSFTTIGGISGHWRYEVDGVEPLANARDYPITSDCFVELIPF